MPETSLHDLLTQLAPTSDGRLSPPRKPDLNCLWAYEVAPERYMTCIVGTSPPEEQAEAEAFAQHVVQAECRRRGYEWDASCVKGRFGFTVYTPGLDDAGQPYLWAHPVEDAASLAHAAAAALVAALNTPKP